MKENMTRITISAPKEIVEEFQKIVFLQEKTVSAVMRTLMLQYLNNKDKHYI